MAAPPTAPDLPTQPDPGPGPGAPPGISRLLGLLHWLIDYGKTVAVALQQSTADPRFALWARCFGTTDVALILTRIARGLLRAAALETRLNQRAARGQDFGPVRTPAAPTPCTTEPRARRAGRAEHSALANLPTAQEIAAEVRRRPIGAIIADICHDFGITPGQLDRATWQELVHAIIAYRGSLSRYFKAVIKRCLSAPFTDRTAIAPPARSAPEMPFAVAATGPP